MGLKQIKLGQSQLDHFDHIDFVDLKIRQLKELLDIFRVRINSDDAIVDIGRYSGYFAGRLTKIFRKRYAFTILIRRHLLVVVIKYCIQYLATLWILPIIGDKKLVCLNLILDHLVGKSEVETRAMQVKALSAWNN